MDKWNNNNRSYALQTNLKLPPGPPPHLSLLIITPPSIANGLATIQITAILHSNKAETNMPINRPTDVSSIVAKVSVVNPLSAVMSSERIFERIPGALSLLSNHPIYLYIKDL